MRNIYSIFDKVYDDGFAKAIGKDGRGWGIAIIRLCQF